MRTKTILFDLGNVLLYFSHERMFEQIGSICGRSCADVQQFLEQSELMDRFDRGQVDDGAFQIALERWCGRPLDADDLRTAVSDIFCPNETLLRALPGFKELGLRLVLMSNTCPPHIDFVRENWSFLDLFDEVILSYEVGAMKPESAIYEAALQASQCRPEECFYTDDLDPYVLAARDRGIDAVVFRNNELLRAQLAERGIRFE